jgi:site-specific DNA-methyltransferase (adenine-specific)
MAVRIEDAGFEIRDLIAWVYGSGFPKSMDVSKAIDKAAGAEREVVGQRKKLQSYGADVNDVYGGGPDEGGVQLITAPATPEAQQWQGWGTALKPAFEPVILARKPFASTVAANVLERGVGGLNVDGCRVAPTGESLHGGGSTVGKRAENHNEGWQRPWMKDESAREAMRERSASSQAKAEQLGRWPANFIHDGSEGATELLGDAARFFYTAKASKADRDAGCEAMEAVKPRQVMGLSDSGGERSAVRNTPSRNHHPTVKPTDLMRYLCRLVTPPGGIVLDPFTGSGSTGKAAILEGFRFIGIEREAEYIEIARARIQREADKPRQPTLFD